MMTRNIYAFCDAGDIQKLHFKVALYITNCNALVSRSIIRSQVRKTVMDSTVFH